jgi:hypothetical protein
MVRGVNDIVSDDADANPALHSDMPLVAATAEAMSPIDYSDESLAFNAPLLASISVTNFPQIEADQRPSGVRTPIHASRTCW